MSMYFWCVQWQLITVLDDVRHSQKHLGSGTVNFHYPCKKNIEQIDYKQS